MCRAGQRLLAPTAMAAPLRVIAHSLEPGGALD
jgi:hypothetical protein